MSNLKDSSNNISCLEQSAENNDESEQFNLALLYEEGAEKNLEKAFYW